MKPVELLEILHTAERLKDVTRHSYTSGGRHESVAEHSWRITLMAFLLRDEFPELDMDKVLRMCLIHDLGECFTGDIPAFDKTADDSAREEELLGAWVAQLPQPVRGEMAELYAEMEALGTPEADVYKRQVPDPPRRAASSRAGAFPPRPRCAAAARGSRRGCGRCSRVGSEHRSRRKTAPSGARPVR